MSLTIPCLQKRGIILHELGHLIGFYHEQQRPDRDDYIEVIEENIEPRYLQQFVKGSFRTYGPYDFDSIMHYPMNYYAFQNDSMVLRPNVTVPEGVDVGYGHSLSSGDRKKANLMYACPSKRCACACACACAVMEICILVLLGK